MKPVLGGIVIACLSLLGAQFGMGPGPGTAHSTGPSTLMAFWEFNEGSGTTVTDHSTSGNNLTITAGSGSWTTQAGLSGGAYAFNSTRADSANNTNVNFDFNQAFSVSVWFNRTGVGSGEQELVGHLDTANNFRGWEMHSATGTLAGCTTGWHVDVYLISTYPSNAINVSSCPVANASTLYNYVMTYDGSHTAAGVKFYVNGSSVTTVTNIDALTTTMTNAKVIRVGERADNSIPFAGNMGPIGIWNRVLTAGEAATIAGSPYAIVN